MKIKISIKKIFLFLGSLKTGLFLLGLIIVSSFVGTLIPQGLSPEEYVRHYGETAYSFFRSLGFTSLYYSRWFVSLLVLLGLNLLFCTIERISFKKRSLVLLHFSLILILSGSVLTALFTEKGYLSLREGQTADSFLSEKGEVDLPFSLTLNDFELEFYPPADHRIGAYCPQMEQGVICRLKPGESCGLEGSPYTIYLKEYFAHLVMTGEGPENRSEKPLNPAVLLEITRGGEKEERWVFADYPGMMPVKFKDLKLAYAWQAPVKEYSSHITVQKQGDSKETVIRVNRPFRCEGYIVYQMNYDQDDLSWTGLRVKKDPGAKVIFVGFLILNLSVFFYYYKKIKERKGDG